MARRACSLVLASLLLVGCGGGEGEQEVGPPVVVDVTVSPEDDVQSIVEGLGGPARVMLQPGVYELDPVPYDDPSCGNCEEPAIAVRAVRGLRVSGQGITIAGTSPAEVVIRTQAGYGVLFDGCEDCRLQGVTVTGGVRNPDPNATDGAVVVREGRVTVEGCTLQDNIGDPEVVGKTVVGIIGLVGREGAEMTVRNTRIIRNSWDGIALYRGAQATIRDTVIDGIDRVRGAEIGGGRGSGIGLTWNAHATVESVLVRNYWKGIGVFVDARAEVRSSIVEDVLTWGMTVWDAARGRPAAHIEGNVIYRSGACGAAVIRHEPCGADEPCAFRGNAIILAGGDEAYDAPDIFCRQEALAEEAVGEGFMIAGNLFLTNRVAGGGADPRDQPRAAFLADLEPLAAELLARPALSTSIFLQDYRSGRLAAP